MELDIRTLKGEHLDIRIDSTSHVKDLKHIISEIKPELPAEEQKLVYKGKVIADDTMIQEIAWELGELIVVFGTTKKPKKLDIHIISFAGGALLELQMARTSTVLDLKGRIMDACDIPTHVQQLVLQNKILSDGEQLKTFGEEVVLNLVRLPEEQADKDFLESQHVPPAPANPAMLRAHHRGRLRLANRTEGLLGHMPRRLRVGVDMPALEVTRPPEWIFKGLEGLSNQELQSEVKKRTDRWNQGGYKHERVPHDPSQGPREPPTGST